MKEYIFSPNIIDIKKTTQNTDNNYQLVLSYDSNNNKAIAKLITLQSVSIKSTSTLPTIDCTTFSISLTAEIGSFETGSAIAIGECNVLLNDILNTELSFSIKNGWFTIYLEDTSTTPDIYRIESFTTTLVEKHELNVGIYKNGEKISGIYKNGKLISKIYHNKEIIYQYKPSFKIVSFSEGTDKEIAAMLEAHYAGIINLSEHWNVGDTRLVHIDATNSGTIDHVAQNMTMVIMDFDRDDLVTPINGKTKAAVSVGFREVMANNGESAYEYYYDSSHSFVDNNENYTDCPLRTWLNGELLNALPSTFNSMIKEVNKKNLKYHKGHSIASVIDTSVPEQGAEPDIITTKDKIFLLSYSEVFGNTASEYYLNASAPLEYEGAQYEWFKTSDNILKSENNNGEMGSLWTLWWLRSPSSEENNNNGYYMLNILSAIIYITGGNGQASLAPAFCL